MKKLLVLVALLALAAIPSMAQFTNGPYLVDYFSNNTGPGGPDGRINLVNYGLFGTPTSGNRIGYICANVYVFAADQQMVECCSCLLSPNGFLTISVANDLTDNPLTGVVPANGAIKIITTNGGPAGAAGAARTCDPRIPFDAALLPLSSAVAWGVHVQTTAAATYLTEANTPQPLLSVAEATFLPNACNFVQYLGTGQGKCTCQAETPSNGVFLTQ